jgi:hypothetical protein
MEQEIQEEERSMKENDHIRNLLALPCVLDDPMEVMDLLYNFVNRFFIVESSDNLAFFIDSIFY